MSTIIARLKEPSTWQAITGVVAVLAGVAGAVMAEKE